MSFILEINYLDAVMLYASLYILPLGGMFLCAATALICCYCLLRRCLAVRGRADIHFDPEKLWEAANLDQEIDSRISKHLDEVVASFKAQIPMATMFITQAREDKLKEQAHSQLIKAIPEIKQLLLQSRAIDELKNSFILVGKQLWLSWTWKLCLLAGLGGFIFGFFEAWILSRLNH